ncbi:hypothetical protein AHiyo8_19680 [Arthrobacter sp. Hiyo8]|nr:hypothetical protein AHiyo8_19680 [Arthrobacter sp. Hiyo8]
MRTGLPTCRMDGQGGSRFVVHQHGARILDRCSGAHGAHEHAEWAGKTFFGAEYQAPNCGMESVGPDDQVEATGRSPPKLDVDSAVVLVQGGDRVVPDDAACLLGLLKQQADEVGACDLDLDLSVAVGALPGGDGGLRLPVGIDEDQAFDTSGGLLQARPDAHLPCNSDRVSAYVDGVATRSRIGRSFHNRD